MKCPDCQGSGTYRGFNITPEDCQCCNGLGVVGEEAPLEKQRQAKARALESIAQGNLPDWMEGHLDKIDFAEKLINELDEDPDSGWSVTSPDTIRVSSMAPDIHIGDTIHVYDTGWYDAEVVQIYQDNQGRAMIRADAPCDTFRIGIIQLSYNITQKRWECIRAGTPVW